MQSEIQPTLPDPLWEQMSPLLDEALATLGETDRQAVLLRFFENKSLADVGSHLGTGEDTARKRISRALEKLHRYFNKRGVASTTVIIAGAMSANSVQAAPVTLAKSMAAVAITKGAAASGSTLTLIKGALKIMAWTKAKTVIVIGMGVFIGTGTVTITVKEIQKFRDYPWQVEQFNSDILKQVSPQVRIVPTKFPQGGPSGSSNDKVLGLGQPIKEIIQAAYGASSSRIALPAELPTNRYDFIANLPHGSTTALQQEIKRTFRIVGKREMRETDVLLLKIQRSTASGLKRSDLRGLKPHEGSGSNSSAGEFSCRNSSLSTLASFLESYLGVPIVDQTELTNNFDIDLKWEQSDWKKGAPDALKQALASQTGLELIPSREPVEILVMEKTR